MKGNIFRFRMGIPADLQHHFDGRSFYVRSLGTGDITDAKHRRDEMEREFRKLLADLRQNGMTTTARDTIRDLGATWAEELAQSREDAHAWTAKITGRDPESIKDEDVEDAYSHVMEKAEQIERSHGEDAKSKFLNEAFGHVEVNRYADEYLNEADLAPKTKRDRRGHLNRLAKWADQKGLRLKDVTRRQAGIYYTEELTDRDRRTSQKHLTSLRQYWDYLARRGLVTLPNDDNPWDRQMLANRGRRVERGARANDEREFTADEMKRLLFSAQKDRENAAGRSDLQQIDDVMRIAALTGMRLAEIISLWAGDVVTDHKTGKMVIAIEHGKTGAAIRCVPVHTDIEKIVERRIKGKQPTEWLFHELQELPDPSDTFSKRFRRYRERLGVDDKREGKRRSLANFHSFRRWFVTEAERAGQPRSTIASIVGHQEWREGITFGTYSGGPAEEQMRTCVESVKLPAPD